MVEMVYINPNDIKSKKYRIKFLSGNKKVVTKELPKSRNVPDINQPQLLQSIISLDLRI